MKGNIRRRLAFALPIGIAAALLVAFLTGPHWGPLNSFATHKQDFRSNSVQLLVAQDATFDVAQDLVVRQSDRADGRGLRDRLVFGEGVQVDGVSVDDAGGSTGAGTEDDAEVDRESAGDLVPTLVPNDRGLDIAWDPAVQDGSSTSNVSIRYRVKGAAEAYDDVVLVRWRVWSDGWNHPLHELDLSVSTASGAAPLKSWLGPADLRAEPTVSPEGGALEATLEGIPPRHEVTVAALYPRSAFRSVEGAVVREGQGRERLIAREDAAFADAGLARAGWIRDHQLPLIAVVLLLLAAGTALLVRLGIEGAERDGGLDALGGRPSSTPPDDAIPAVAAYLATLSTGATRTVLPTLLDLTARGFYDASVSGGSENDPHPADAPRRSAALQVGPDGGLQLSGVPFRKRRRGGDPDPATGRDLVLAIPQRRPSLEGLTAAERDTVDFFDRTLQFGPGALSLLHLRIPEHDADGRARWNALTSALEQAGRDAVSWHRDLRPWRWAMFALALAGFGAIALLAEPRIDSRWLLLAAVPLALAIVLAPSSEMLRHMTPASLARYRQWRGFAIWTTHPDRGAASSRGAAEWERVALLALALGTLRPLAQGGVLPVDGAGPGSWWAGLAERPLAFLVESDFGRSFESTFSGHLASESSDSSSDGGDGGGGD